MNWYHKRRGDRRRRQHRRFRPVGGETLEPQGNVWSFSREIENAVWEKTGVTVDVNVAESPDGTSATVDKLVEDATSGQHRIIRGMPQANASTPQTVIGYALQAERSLLWIQTRGYSGAITHTIINLADGSLERNDAGHDVVITPQVGGFYFFKITALASAIGAGSSAPVWRFNLARVTTSMIYTGTAGSGLYLWDLRYHPNSVGADLEAEYEEPPPSTGGPGLLRVGMFDGGRILGLGPDRQANSVATPIYRVAHLVPNLSQIDVMMDLAEEHDVLLVLNFYRNAGQQLTDGVFDLDKTKGLATPWGNHARLRRFIEDRKAVGFVIDEPNHQKFNGSLHPDMVNELGLHYKSIWPGIICVVRANGETMKNGWNNRSAPQTAGGLWWSGIDYGWMQFGPQHSPGDTFSTLYAEHKQLLVDVDLGMVPGLNYLNGGNTTFTDNIEPCWDHQDNGTSFGVVVGSSDLTFAPGVRFTCGDSRITTALEVYSNPQWSERAVQIAAQDADAPFFMYWMHLEIGGQADQLVALETQENVVTGLRRGVNHGLARQTWTGWRSIK